MTFANACIKESVWISVANFLELVAFAHGCRNDRHLAVGGHDVKEGCADRVRISLACRGF